MAERLIEAQQATQAMLTQAFGQLSECMTDMSAAFREQGNVARGQSFAGTIRPFKGEPKAYGEWITQIEKGAILGRLDDDGRKMLAYQTAAGPVSEFLSRYYHDHPVADWVVVKRELADRFAEVTDSQHAFTLLRQIKQRPDESVQMFAERMLTLADQAFREQQGGLPAVQRQLIDFFIDGLAHDYLRIKIMRENPATLAEATESARAEQNVRARIALRQPFRFNPKPRREEPMDIDHARERGACLRCGKQGHWAKQCYARKRFPVQSPKQAHRQTQGWRQSPQSGQRRAVRITATEKELVRCTKCGFTPKKRPTDTTVQWICWKCRGQKFPEVECWTCKEKGHYANQCPKFVSAGTQPKD